MNARALVVLSVAASIASSRAVDVTLNPIQDATLYESLAGNLAGGADDSLFVGATAGGSIRRALLQFDIAASIPAGSVINSATLGLTFDKGGNGSPITVELHRVNASWSEGVAVPAGEGGSGAAATSGSATWLHRSFDTSLWSAAGGDFSGTSSGSMLVSTFGGVTSASFGLAADVQDWLDDPAQNFGWMLIGGESISSSAMRFNSREGVVQPTLSISYSAVPEPAAGALLLLGAGALWARRRRQ
jgi:hypothetical protein